MLCAAHVSIEELAKKKGVSMAQIAMAWVMAKWCVVDRRAMGGRVEGICYKRHVTMRRTDDCDVLIYIYKIILLSREILI